MIGNEMSSVLWLTLKVLIIVLLINTDQSFFVYQNF